MDGRKGGERLPCRKKVEMMKADALHAAAAA
jgi:hypothetical protein